MGHVTSMLMLAKASTAEICGAFVFFGAFVVAIGFIIHTALSVTDNIDDVISPLPPDHPEDRNHFLW